MISDSALYVHNMKAGRGIGHGYIVYALAVSDCVCVHGWLRPLNR